MPTHSKKKGRKRRKEARNTAKEEEKKAKIYKRVGRENQKRRKKNRKKKDRRQKIRGRIERRRRDATVPSLPIEIQVLLWGLKTEGFYLINHPHLTPLINHTYSLDKEPRLNVVLIMLNPQCPCGHWGLDMHLSCQSKRINQQQSFLATECRWRMHPRTLRTRRAPRLSPYICCITTNHPRSERSVPLGFLHI